MKKLFELYEGDNIGGVLRIEIAHTNDFLGFNPILFKKGKDFLVVPFVPNNAQLKEEEQITKNGETYSYAGFFMIHKPDKYIDSLLRQYIGLCSVMRLTDLNGQVKIIGSPACPITLSREADQGSNPIDRAHTLFKYSVTQPHPAL